MTEEQIIKALSLGEDDDWEFKDGRGGIGKSFMQSVSAFTNTVGGVIICGVESKDNDRRHAAVGIGDPAKYRQNLWNALHDKNTISHSPCVGTDVWAQELDGKTVICVRVPPADRRRRPVYVGPNPLTGTYKRRHTGDYLCDEQEVRQMLRDAASEAQDALIVTGTTLEDIDALTLAAYRNLFASRSPAHPFLLLDDKGLLQKLGAWTRDRATHEEGLTLAGVMMFGTDDAIRHATPDLHFDYQERISTDASTRYDDRFTSDDGGWVPNLFNFYHKAFPRLVEGLKIPFALGDDAMREGETGFHKALREALVNTLVHADYRSRGSIRVLKLRDAYVFNNPRRSLTPVHRIVEARHAGASLTDIRNPALVRMFSLLGLAERQGGGYPTIFRAWDEGKRHSPHIEEDFERNITSVTLPLLSQIDPAIEAKLRGIVGPEYALLSALDKDILLHAYQFGETSNQAVQFSRKEHARDIGDRLKFLADKGWLKRHGTSGRGRTYRFAGRADAGLFDSALDPVVGGGASNGRPPPPLKPPLPPQKEDLTALANTVRGKDRVSRKDMEAVILELCRGQYLTAREVADLVGRTTNKLREQYISRLVADGRLMRLHELAGHPEQAYTTVT